LTHFASPSHPDLGKVLRLNVGHDILIIGKVVTNVEADSRGPLFAGYGALMRMAALWPASPDGYLQMDLPRE
jgi:hypothetical protein